jgi:metal-sulfur cluster biosynthetic enzyme
MSEASERIETEEREAPEASVEAAAPVPADSPPNGDPSTVGQGDASSNGKADVSKDEILEELKAVIDPELGINIVDLGLVYDVDIADAHVHVTYTLTTMGCPIGPLIEAQMHQLLDPLPGIDSFDAEMVLRPPWSPEMMSEEAKEALGYF